MKKTRSTGFPRIPLTTAVAVMEQAFKYGKAWSKEEFAHYGSKSNASSANSGAFASRVAALRDYGLINTTKDGVNGTELSDRIVNPVNGSERADSLRVAFFNVRLFEEIYASLAKDIELQKTSLAEVAVLKFGVARDTLTKNKFTRSFIESGKLTDLVEEKDKSSFIMRPVSNDDESVQVGDNIEQFQGLEQPAVNHYIASKEQTDYANTLSIRRSGDNWAIVVSVKFDTIPDVQFLTKVSELLEAAESLADKLGSPQGKEADDEPK